MFPFSNPLNALAVLLLLTWSWQAYGSSAPAKPLKRLAHPSTRALEILPRQPRPPSTHKRASSPLSPNLRHDDSFRLIISAFDDTFHLHLRPNDHLIHPAARINYYSTTPDGHSYISSTKPLLRESVKAYWGEVIHRDHSSTRLREDAASLARHGPHPAEIGWARIIVHHQGDMDRGIAPVFEGAFTVNGNIHHVTTKDNYLRNKQPLDPEIARPLDYADSQLVIWRESDVMTAEEEHFARTGIKTTSLPAPPHTCGHDKLSHNVDPAENAFLQKPRPPVGWTSAGLMFNGALLRRDDVVGNGMTSNFADKIGQTDGCPKDQKVLYMGVAADCKYVSMYGSRDNATQQILSNWNTASSLYKTSFNVSLGIIELQIQDPTCPTATNQSIPWNVDCGSVTLNDRLSLFSQWRGDKGEDGVGLWHLMSGCPTGTEVGIAWLATLCQQTASGNAGSVVSGTAVSTGGRTEWQVVAHETGHNFGAIHDCAEGCNSTSSCCPLSTGTCNAGAQFIMSPVAQSSEKVFSQCTLGNICSVMKGVQGSQTNTTCLLDAGDNTRKVISLQMCGNGIVETGEDCDPGSGVNSNCCDSVTCKFKNGAVCDPDSSACCTDRCSFAPATQVCRASKDDKCDTAETCTGTSAGCPTDRFSPNGQSCGNNGLACASGQCTSVALQCQTVGASMGLTSACPNRGDNTCQVSCQDPSKSNSCVLLSALLVDGSPCGYGGTCSSGRCQSGGILDTAKAWYTQNLQISIPVTVVAGIVVLFLLFCVMRGLRRCCTRSRPSPARANTLDPTLSGLRHERLNSYDRALRNSAVPPPTFMGPSASIEPPPAVRARTRPRHAAHSRSQSRTNWIDESLYNGPPPRR